MTPASPATLRQMAAAAIEEQIDARIANEHRRNYHKLHVHRDASVSWFTDHNRNSDLIDQQAEGFTAIQSVCQVGTGSCLCNCDYCDDVYNPAEERYCAEVGEPYNRAEKYETHEDAISDAVSATDNSDALHQMLTRLEEIPAGYFDDEESPE